MRTLISTVTKQIMLLFLLASLMSLHAQNVGIGTTSPAFKLDVQNGSINTDSLYRIGTFTVLSVLGNANLFVGRDAGKINTGINNTFNGDLAGFNNTNGRYNSFFGSSAGYDNLDGEHNSFFGRAAGLFNTTGHYNSFFGRSAGYSNITGTFNTALGFFSNVNTDALTNATAIGANARVDCNNCMVLGSVIGINGASATVNVGVGTTSPNARLDVNGTLKVVDGTQGAGKILTSDATGLASWQSPPPSPTYYQSIGICCQSWMTKNLNVSTYRNGDPIPKVTDAAAWAALTTGAYCYYNNDSTMYAAIYGKLYNWYAVNDIRGIAPEGWHIPTDFEWTTLGNCLGGNAVAGGFMKEIGITHWLTPNTGATNFSGFTGLPGGSRNANGVFGNFGGIGFCWSSSELDANFAADSYLFNNSDDLTKSIDEKKDGFSVRCVRD